MLKIILYLKDGDSIISSVDSLTPKRKNGSKTGKKHASKKQNQQSKKTTKKNLREKIETEKEKTKQSKKRKRQSEEPIASTSSNGFPAKKKRTVNTSLEVSV